MSRRGEERRGTSALARGGLGGLGSNVEPLVPVLGGLEDVGEDEVQERPELVEVVLERRAGDEEAVLREEGANDLRELGVLVLETMGLRER